MGFLTEDAPAYGAPLTAAPGVSRVVAPNPGPLTYHGTNTWLVEDEDGLHVVDPGPDDRAHLRALVDAAGPRPVARILLTHAHRDHSGAVSALAAASGAAVWGFGAPGFAPDHPVRDGDRVGAFHVLHTPGHAADHCCFAWRGLLFSGDHVMAWSTSVVSPPDGDMTDYMASLRRTVDRPEEFYLTGHGPPHPQGRALARAMLAHRAAREAAIADAITAGPRTPEEIVDALYAGLDPALKPAAARSVLAHLQKLERDGRARQAGNRWEAV